MRLISLLLTLVIIGAVIIYYKNSGTLPTSTSASGHTTQQKALDDAKRATAELNKTIEQTKKRLEELDLNTQP